MLVRHPPVEKRGAAVYFIQFNCVEIYCLNLTHLEQGTIKGVTIKKVKEAVKSVLVVRLLKYPN